MRALLLIGLQIDLLPGGIAEVAGGDNILDTARKLMGQFDWVIAARFWLPVNHLSFAANHPWRQPGQTITIEGRPTLLQPMYCVQNSFGAEFAPGLSEKDFSYIADMGTEPDSFPFSAFYDTGKKRDTGLTAFLKSKNINGLTIIGLPGAVLNNTVWGINTGCLWI